MSKEILSKLKKELAPLKNKGGIYAVLAAPEDYNQVIDYTLAVLTNQLNLTGIFVSVGKNFDSMNLRFKNSQVKSEKLFFVDASGERNKAEHANCFVCSTKSLVGLSLAIGEAAHTGRFNFMLLDSMSSLLIYNDVKSTQKFAHFILSKMKNMGMSSVVITLNDAESQKLLPIVSQFCDKVISLQ